MRAQLALAVVLGLTSIGDARAAGLEPPRDIDGGSQGLAQWIEKNAALTGGVADTAEVDTDAKLVLAVLSPYSGVSALDAYIYGCSPRSCTRIATRYYIRTAPGEEKDRRLRLVLSKDHKVVTVQSRQGAEMSILLPPKQ